MQSNSQPAVCQFENLQLESSHSTSTTQPIAQHQSLPESDSILKHEKSKKSGFICDLTNVKLYNGMVEQKKRISENRSVLSLPNSPTLKSVSYGNSDPFRSDTSLTGSHVSAHLCNSGDKHSGSHKVQSPLAKNLSSSLDFELMATDVGEGNDHIRNRHPNKMLNSYQPDLQDPVGSLDYYNCTQTPPPVLKKPKRPSPLGNIVPRKRIGSTDDQGDTNECFSKANSNSSIPAASSLRCSPMSSPQRNRHMSGNSCMDNIKHAFRGRMESTKLEPDVHKSLSHSDESSQILGLKSENRKEKSLEYIFNSDTLLVKNRKEGKIGKGFAISSPSNTVKMNPRMQSSFLNGRGLNPTLLGQSDQSRGSCPPQGKPYSIMPSTAPPNGQQYQQPHQRKQLLQPQHKQQQQQTVHIPKEHRNVNHYSKSQLQFQSMTPKHISHSITDTQGAHDSQRNSCSNLQASGEGIEAHSTMYQEGAPNGTGKSPKSNTKLLCHTASGSVGLKPHKQHLQHPKQHQPSQLRLQQASGIPMRAARNAQHASHLPQSHTHLKKGDTPLTLYPSHKAAMTTPSSSKGLVNNGTHLNQTLHLNISHPVAEVKASSIMLPRANHRGSTGHGYPRLNGFANGVRAASGSNCKEIAVGSLV